MDGSQEEKLRIILGFRMETMGGRVYSQQVYQYRNKTVCGKDELKKYLQSGNGQVRIRQRVRELWCSETDAKWILIHVHRNIHCLYLMCGGDKREFNCQPGIESDVWEEALLWLAKERSES